jgi:hypothetical protein
LRSPVPRSFMLNSSTVAVRHSEAMLERFSEQRL